MLSVKAHKLRLLLAAGSVLVCCVRMEETTVYSLTVQAEIEVKKNEGAGTGTYNDYGKRHNWPDWGNRFITSKKNPTAKKYNLVAFLPGR